MGGSVLASGSTMASTHQSLDARRMCTIRTINIAEPVDVYELCEVSSPEWDSLKLNYEKALADFERQEFMAAEQTLLGILQHHPNDIPTQRLLERLAITAGSATSFDPVWNLSGK